MPGPPPLNGPNFFEATTSPDGESVAIVAKVGDGLGGLTVGLIVAGQDEAISGLTVSPVTFAAAPVLGVGASVAWADADTLMLGLTDPTGLQVAVIRVDAVTKIAETTVPWDGGTSLYYTNGAGGVSGQVVLRKQGNLTFLWPVVRVSDDACGFLVSDDHFVSFSFVEGPIATDVQQTFTGDSTVYGLCTFMYYGGLDPWHVTTDFDTFTSVSDDMVWPADTGPASEPGFIGLTDGGFVGSVFDLNDFVTNWAVTSDDGLVWTLRHPLTVSQIHWPSEYPV